MQRVRANELRAKEEKDLLVELTKYREELSKLRVSKVSSAPQTKLARIRIVRKAIARVLTVINTQRREKHREATKKHKFTPKDLRAKKSRAWRKQLSKHEKTRKTIRQQKRDSNFKLRKFALAA